MASHDIQPAIKMLVDALKMSLSMSSVLKKNEFKLGGKNLKCALKAVVCL